MDPSGGADLAHELAVARALAEQAARVVLAYVGQPIDVERKAGDEPVTRADKEANEVIVAGLRAAFPADGLLAEETPDDGTRLSRARVWMVDPIDGTRDFISGRDGFAVMIGLAEAGRPILGVVHQPLGARVYHATRGGGAFMTVGDGAAIAIRTSGTDELVHVRLVASKSHRSKIIDEVRTALGTSDEFNVGSVGLKLGLIARGERDLYVNPSSRSSVWDTCGPEAILTEAGGRLTDLYGRPLEYAHKDVRNRNGLIASNGVVHDAVLARLAPLFPGPGQAGED
jgi:3'(2'), 5'-bisphosphate nucleotidase